MEEYTKMLRKKGISLEKFIGLRDKKSGNLPLYKVTYKGEISYLYSEEELEKFIKMKKEAEGRELEILEEDDTVAVEQEQAEGSYKSYRVPRRQGSRKNNKNDRKLWFVDRRIF